MKTFIWLTLLLISELGHGGVKLDLNRKHLDSLDSRGRLDWTDYQQDVLLSQSAEVSDVSQLELIERLRKQHGKTKIDFKLSDPQFSENFPLPQPVIKGDQLKGLQDCNLEKCAFKFHTATETEQIIRAKDRVKELKTLMALRLKEYETSKKLKGYEDRLDNIPYFKKAIRLGGFLRARYPKSYRCLESNFWTPGARCETLKNSYFRSEVVHITGDKMQPVYRLTHNVEFEESGYLNVEVHIYTNHFFDFSVRLFEVFGWPLDSKKSVYVVTDMLEIDELKKSELIRKLFKSRMEEAVSEFRKTEMKELR